MAKKDAKEYGKKFFDDLVALYPADKQQTVRDIVTAMPETVLQHVGDHILRQDDYSEAMNAVTQLRAGTEKWRQDLQTWKTSIDAQLTEGAAAVERLKGLDASGGHIIKPDDDDVDGKATPPVDLSGYVKKADVDKLVQDAVANAQGYATNYGAYMTGLVGRHLKEFDEALDTGALLAFCRENNLQIDRGGYDAFVRERRETVAKTKRDEEIKAAEERGYRKALSDGSSELPFPTTPGGGEHVTLSGLGNINKDGTVKDPKFDKSTAVSRAVATYNEEIRKRSAGGAS
jgi:hypothetical protein